MPPTIQSNKGAEQRPQRSAERRSDYVCRVKFCNTLPDIPFDPKFLQYPFDGSRFIQYKPTTLERNYKYEVLTEHDLGVTIDLINKDAYNNDPNAILDPADEKLLEEDILTPQDSKRSRHHARSVSWLRRTEYISTELTRFQPQTMDKVEAKVGYSIKKNFKEDTLIMDRTRQLLAIDKTFEDTAKEIKTHFKNKPNVVPVEIIPLFPDFSSWRYPCAQVIFDSDPAPQGRPIPAQLEEMSQAMIRGVMDEEGEQFVAYFLPTEDTLEKRKLDVVNEVEYEDDKEYEYKMTREYNWNLKNKASKGYEENYFFVFREDGVYYNELETRVRLSKRRQKPGQAPSNTKLVVKHRPINEIEYKEQRYRERQLEPPGDEEDEESEPEPAPETVTITKTGEKQKEESDKESDDGSESGSHKSRSRSRSGSRKSRSRSKSGSGSRKSRSRSASGSRKSRSRSASGSRKSRSRSASGSRKSRSASGSNKSRSRSASGSRKSRSRSKSGSVKSRSRSGSGSHKSASERKSRSRSKSGSASRSPSPGSGSASDSGSSKRKSGDESNAASGSESD